MRYDPFPGPIGIFLQNLFSSENGVVDKEANFRHACLAWLLQKSSLNYIQECFDRSPSLSRNMDKTLDFKKLYLTNCQNLFQRIDALSTTVGFDFRLSVKISTRQDKKQKNYSCVTSLELVNKNTKVKTVCYVLWPSQIISQWHRVFLIGVDNRKRQICALIR